MEPPELPYHISEETLRALLSESAAPVPQEGDPAASRKLLVASHVYDCWTARGSHPAGLADRFVDGSIGVLEETILSTTLKTRQKAATCHSAADSHSSTAGSCRRWSTEIIPRHDASDLTYDEFVCQYMARNLPVIICGLAADWRASREWVTGDGRIDVDQLTALFGDSRVCVTDTSRQAAGCATQADMTLRGYTSYWHCRANGQDEERLLYLKDWHFVAQHPGYQAYRLPHYFHDDWLNRYYDLRHASSSAAAAKLPWAAGQPQCDAGHADSGTGAPQHAAACGSTPLHNEQSPRNSQRPTAAFSTASSAQKHCGADAARQSPPAERRGEAPHADDAAAAAVAAALGEHGGSSVTAMPSDAVASGFSTSDYRFVYWGPAGSWTQLHADVLRSFSWSTNVAGRKGWLLLPPQHTHLLYDVFGRDMPTRFTDESPRFPNLAAAAQHVVEVVQEAGETIFVPSGWHHTVENLADTLSINHNWLNGFNLHWGWALLRQEWRLAADSIADCRATCTEDEFDGLVQRILAANSGLDLHAFHDFLASIVEEELAALHHAGHEATWQRLMHAFHLQRAGFVLADLEQTSGLGKKALQQALSWRQYVTKDMLL